MKIAALIEVHHRPDLLARLLNRLAGELWAPYVHIDRKSDRSEFLPIVQHACFFDSVYSVRYSAFSQVLATLFLMKRALQDKSNTHFYLMSGQCFPIKTDVDIALTIVSDSGNYIEVYKMAQEFLFRLTEWRFRDHPIASSRIGSAIENKSPSISTAAQRGKGFARRATLWRIGLVAFEAGRRSGDSALCYAGTMVPQGVPLVQQSRRDVLPDGGHVPWNCP